MCLVNRSHSKLEEYEQAAARHKEAQSKLADNDRVIGDLNRELEALKAKLAEAERCVHGSRLRLLSLIYIQMCVCIYAHAHHA